MPSKEIPQQSGRKDRAGAASNGTSAAAESRSNQRVKGARAKAAATAGVSQPAAGPGRRGPLAVISRRAADRLRGGHVWVYRSDVEKVSMVADSRLMHVVDQRGASLGTGLYSTSSLIALRMVSREIIDENAWQELLRARVLAAVQYRRRLLEGGPAGTDSCRLIFSEADFLPGLVADRYGDLVVLQFLTQGMATPMVRATIVEVLREETDVRAVFERSDPKIVALEQLDAGTADPLFSRSDPPAHFAGASTVFRLNGLKFHYDANSGQKTGAFLDQRENYAAAAKHCRGHALDVCTYQGGFALHLARSCETVTGVDSSRSALEVAEQNLALNRDSLGKLEVEWFEANAFDLLREWSDSRVLFDSIVVDPPAFAKSKRAAEGALRGYKELNLRALKMLRPGGTLVTCSCSHHVGIEEFTAVVAAAAADARRQVRLIERRGAAADHPVLLGVPETEYLKCLICIVES
ncbi:LSU m5C1962 methyltransferase RlmI [Acidisarcina polymorpha]|uniref:LSU m5C1962 methyltransferase RlmI n=1 Tax=Acidisarcina polymorpha TaxID=2211140 RepID=A0A2Z5FUT8_9BACT|nr:class I SAM-dependent rRNA methyltransferase [Acidisarcina polymorpha]AXC10638.1 LSU m5C1962 methyltransferase RlmI [Acidisarcina polymorpha]